ncbi:LptF/LptG family permease [bacterium]|nr:LptF/LptG family permease [bacterium]
MPIIPRYIIKSFIFLILFCIAAVVVLFVIVDSVEQMDKFIDKDVPVRVILQYYLYYIPYVLVLVLPVATLLATVFSIGNLARNNEIIALKALGYSLYQILGTVLMAGVFMALISFVTAEVIVAKSSAMKVSLELQYGLKSSGRVKLSKLSNLEIRNHDQLITLGRLNPQRRLATRIKIEKIVNGRITNRIDADSMVYKAGKWHVLNGYERFFNKDNEIARQMKDSLIIDLNFSPEELVRSQGKPEDMGYWDLRRYISLMNRSGADVHAFLTELHLRISFPLSNFIIVLFALPLAYNMKKTNMAIGFGIALSVCFFYFGLVKMGQSMGQNGSISPVIGAWLGNGIMAVGSVINLIKTRK